MAHFRPAPNRKRHICIGTFKHIIGRENASAAFQCCGVLELSRDIEADRRKHPEQFAEEDYPSGDYIRDGAEEWGMHCG
jgi:hypothetical protein